MTSDPATAVETKLRAKSAPADTQRLAFLADLPLALLFLGLVFLLGIFPLKDTDFWWHLRTGDLIRKTGVIPHKDIYTFTAPDKEWIDLHWGFQVGVSWLYGLGGVDACNLAKCAITTLGLLILITTRRPGRRLWVMVVAWLPALYVLSGRMYVRPETVTFLYICLFLAILFRWKEKPWLAWFLPMIEVLWVNTQGLFILGPVLAAIGLIDALLSPGFLDKERSAWWRTVFPAAVGVGLATLLNPYGLRGALFPLALVKTMSAPIFEQKIGELTPIPLFIQQLGGFNNFPLQMHIATMVIGALSFAAPLAWSAWVTVADARGPALERAGDKKPSKRKSKAKAKAAPKPAVEIPWLRLLLFVAFSLLSWKATRNSHQFATVVGAVTAWNFADWAWEIGERRRRRKGKAGARKADAIPERALAGGAFAAATLIVAYILVGSGYLYKISGEKRTIAFGEEPLWFPHEAVKASGTEGMPERFLGFNNGHVSLYEYYFGPERKVYIDARLEVIGPELFKEYIDLQAKIAKNAPGWEGELERMGEPVVLTDHATAHGVGSAVLASPNWKCVHFDAIAAVFVHNSYRKGAAAKAVDFGRRHFEPEAGAASRPVAEDLAEAEALKNYASNLTVPEIARPALKRPMVLVGIDRALRYIAARPSDPAGWKVRGVIEAMREPISMDKPIPRFRLPFDPVFDLSFMRVTYNIQKTVRLDPADYGARFQLFLSLSQRGLDEAALPVMEELISLAPINIAQANYQKVIRDALPSVRDRLGSAIARDFRNRGELEERINDALKHGRARTAAELIDQGVSEESRDWPWTDRLTLLRMHLGEPEKARQALLACRDTAVRGLKASRLGYCDLIEDRFDAARAKFQEALRIDPSLFEAAYGLAVTEQDAGRAGSCRAAGRLAESLARNGTSKLAARAIADAAAPYAK